METSDQPVGSRRFRGLTCSKCRARKVRCDGSQPSCKTCDIYGVQCRYDKAPPMSQIISLAQQLHDAQRALAEVRQTTQLSPARSICNSVMGNSSDGAVEVAQQSMQLSLDGQGKINYFGPPSAVHEPAQGHDIDRTDGEGGGEEIRGDYSVDMMNNSEAIPQRIQDPWSILNPNDTFSVWEDYALENAAMRTHIPRRQLARMLHLYWTWVSPMFMWVYRPAFMRDMTSGGRYYSELLLTTLCSHAAKYVVDSHCGAALNSRLRMLLGEAIHEESSIPTVQALLQLSARELADGSLSKAWLYSGMAFRMADDLTLQHHSLDVSHVKGVESLDLEVRLRLAWGCYFWDKAVSLYTGRRPAVPEPPPLSSLDTLDHSADSEIWNPPCQDTSNMDNVSLSHYSNGYAVSCFRNSCKLSIVIGDLIEKLYLRHHKPPTQATVRVLDEKLDSWRAQTPRHLKLDPHNPPETSPPPHIVSQNLLYFTTIILTHRPFWSLPDHYRRCVSAAKSIEALLLLFDATFGFANITYLMGYCIYTGASVMLKEHALNTTSNISSSSSSSCGTGSGSDAESSNRTIRTFLRALSAGAPRCRLLEQSLAIITKNMKPRGFHRNTASAAGTTTAPAAAASSSRGPALYGGGGGDDRDAGSQPMPVVAGSNYIPAFPQADLVGTSGGGYYGAQQQQAGLGLDEAAADLNSGLFFLDCYPEMQLFAGEFMPPAVPPEDV